MMRPEKEERMRVIGYTYEADCHCVECTLKRHEQRPFELSDPLGIGEGNDENGLPYAATDHEGNAVHPVFSTDDCGWMDSEGQWHADYCGDCGCEIK